MWKKLSNCGQLKRFIIILTISAVMIIQSCETESVSPYKTNKVPNAISITITPHRAVAPERTVLAGDSFDAFCYAEDYEGDNLQYSWWFQGGGLLSDSINNAWTRWKATNKWGVYQIGVNVYEDWVDMEHRQDRAAVVDTIWVVNYADLNIPPVIDSVTASPPRVPVNSSVAVVCYARDPDGPNSELKFTWGANAGEIEETERNTALWRAPSVVDTYQVAVDVFDNHRYTRGTVDIAVITEPINRPPVINSFQADKDEVMRLERVHIICDATDPDGPDINLAYSWGKNGGTFQNNRGATIDWIAPDQSDTYTIIVDISDGVSTTRGHLTIRVLDEALPQPPVIESLNVSQQEVAAESAVTVTCIASDPNYDVLTYHWSSYFGRFVGSGHQVNWIAPVDAGRYYLAVSVSDGEYVTSDSVSVSVVADTTETYSSDFSSDDVTGSWVYVDTLAGLSLYLPDNARIYWNEAAEAMAVISNSDFATAGFCMSDRLFAKGTFSVKVKAPSRNYVRVAFIPKFIDANNYFLIGINYYARECHIIYCIDGNVLWPKQEWIAFQEDVYYEITFQYTGSTYTVALDGDPLWSGNMPDIFDDATNIGVAVYGLPQSGPVLFDDLRITNP